MSPSAISPALDQYLSNRRVRQAVASVIGEARAGAIGKLDLRGALHLNEEGLDRVANPDDRVAALGLDLSAIGVRDERAVAQAPRAADILGKPAGAASRPKVTRSAGRARIGQRNSSVSTLEAGTQGS